MCCRRIQAQKELEKILIKEFLSHLGYEISDPDWKNESPDALLTISKQNGKKKRIAIEHTTYFNDTVAGVCSPLTPYVEFWNKVQDNLVCLIKQNKHLIGIIAYILLKKVPPVEEQTKVAKPFAKELITFAKNNPVKVSENYDHPSRPNDFKEYSKLEPYMPCSS